MFERSSICLIVVGYLEFCITTSAPWASPELEKLNKTGGIFDGKLTTDQASWIGSLTTLGCVLGAITYGFLTETVGRKITLIMMALPVIASYFTLAFTTGIYQIYIARILAGLPIGAIWVVLPVYIGEIARNEHRGIISVMSAMLVQASHILTYSAGPYMSYSSFNIMMGILPCIFIPLFFWLGMESPHYLIKHGNDTKAKTGIKKLRNYSDKNDIEEEFKYVKVLVDHEEKGTVMDLLRHKGTQKAMFMVLGTLTFYNFSGILTVLTYTQQIFTISGTSIPPEQCAILSAVIQLLAASINPFLIAKMGRKTLLLVSNVLTAIGYAMLGTSFFLHDQRVNMILLNYLPLLSVIFTIVSSWMGMAVIPLVFLAEIFPNQVKGSATTFATCYFWITSFLVSKSFPILSEKLGPAPVFFGFSIVCLLAIPFTIFYVKETKDKSLKDILNMFNE